MIYFYTKYWKSNAEVFLNENFKPYKPLANYPILKSFSDNLTIIGVYDNCVVDFKERTSQVDVINGQLKENIIFNCVKNFGKYSYKTFNCEGTLIKKSEINLNKGATLLKVPASGMIQLRQL